MRSIVSLRKGTQTYLHYGGGVIINARWILTLRRHLVEQEFDVRSAKWKFNKVHRDILVVPRYSDALRNMHNQAGYKAEKTFCHVYPHKDDYPTFTDIGLIKLKKPIPLGQSATNFHMARIFDKNMPRDSVLVNLGYTEEGPGRKIGKLARWTYTIKTCRNHLEFKSGPLFCAQGRDSVPLYPGEAGSPTFYGQAVAGIASYPQLGNLIQERNKTSVLCG